MNKRVSIISILKNPVFIIIFITLGVIAGLKFPYYTDVSMKINYFYIKFLTLFTLPVFIFSMLSGAVNLVKLQHHKKILVKMFSTFILFTLFSGLLGIALGLLAQPGNGIKIDKMVIAESTKMFNSFQTTTTMELIQKAVPNNFLSALINFNEIGLVIFFIVLGISISYTKNKESFSGTISCFMESLYYIFDRLSIFIPLGAFSLIYTTISNIKIDELLNAKVYIVTFYSLTLIVLLLSFIFLWLYSDQKLSTTFKALIRPIVVSLSTGSSLLSLPFVINIFSKELKFNKITSHLFLPIINTIGRFGNIIYFSFTTIFITQLFNIKLSIIQLLLVLFFSVIIGFLSSSLKGGNIPILILLVITFLGVPATSYLSLLIIMEILIIPCRSLLTTLLTLVCVGLIGKPKSYIDIDDELGVIIQNSPDDVDLKAYFHGYKGEIPVINQPITDLLYAVFPNAILRKYKNWSDIEDLWNNYELDLIIGEKEFIKNITLNNSDDYKFAVVKPKN